jgi:hypothetical protein
LKHIDCIIVFGFILPSLDYFFLLHILFVVHLALQVCYFCNSTQLQHLPPYPQETIQHDQIFHGTKLAVDEAPKEAMQKKIVSIFVVVGVLVGADFIVTSLKPHL